MRPTIRFLDDNLIKQIIAEAINILCNLGVEIHHPPSLSLLDDHGATVDLNKYHARLTGEIVQKAHDTAPSAFRLFDVQG